MNKKCKRCNKNFLSYYNPSYWKNFYEDIQIKREVHLLEKIC